MIFIGNRCFGEHRSRYVQADVEDNQWKEKLITYLNFWTLKS